MKHHLPLCALLASCALATGCETNAATGRREFALVSQESEIKMGAEAVPGMVKDSGGEIPSQAIQTYVRQLGLQLAAKTERPALPWEFHVLNTDVINAFALPGGKVFVTRGILAKMTNEAQLAGVLGHECGHVAAKHFQSRMTAQYAVAGIAAAGVIAGQVTKKPIYTVAGVGAGAIGGVAVLKFSRDEESEADALGVRYMTRLGYNPVAQVQVMEILQKISGNSDTISALFQTHPNPGARIADLNKLIPKQYPDYNALGKYKFEEARFKKEVLDPLKLLPPLAKTKTAFMEPAQFKARFGMDWQVAAKQAECLCESGAQ